MSCLQSIFCLKNVSQVFVWNSRVCAVGVLASLRPCVPAPSLFFTAHENNNGGCSLAWQKRRRRGAGGRRGGAGGAGINLNRTRKRKRRKAREPEKRKSRGGLENLCILFEKGKKFRICSRRRRRGRGRPWRRQQYFIQGWRGASPRQSGLEYRLEFAFLGHGRVGLLPAKRGTRAPNW